MKTATWRHAPKTVAASATRFALWLGAMVFALTAWAGPVSLTCAVPSLPPMTALGACQISFATVTIASNAADFSTIHVEQAAAANGFLLPDGSWQNETAAASLGTTLFYSTAGPTRQGLIEVKVLSTSSNFAAPTSGADAIVGSGVGVSNTGVGPYLIDCTNSGPTGANCNGYYDKFFASMGPGPIQLGASLQLSELSLASATSYGLDGFASGNLDITYQFRLFEADGVTPVAVVTPEPISLLLAAPGIAIVAWLRRRAFAQ